MDRIAQAIIHRQSRSSVPIIQNVETIGLAVYGGFANSFTLRETAAAYCLRKRIRSGREEAGERVRQQFSSADVVLAAGGTNRHRRIGGTAAKAVRPIHGIAELSCIPVHANFPAELCGVLAARLLEYLPQL